MNAIDKVSDNMQRIDAEGFQRQVLFMILIIILDILLMPAYLTSNLIYTISLLMHITVVTISFNKVAQIKEMWQAAIAFAMNTNIYLSIEQAYIDYRRTDDNQGDRSEDDRK